MAQGDIAITCDNKALIDIYTLLNSCFGVKANGDVYLREEQYTQEAAEGDAVTCSNGLTPEELFIHNLRLCVVKNAEGKNALRLGHL